MSSRPVIFGTLPSARREEVLLLFDNRLLGRKGASVTADSEDAESAPATNLLTENKSEPWRSGSVATRSQAATPEIVLTYSLLGLGVKNAAAVDTVYLAWSNLLLPWYAELYTGDPDAGGALRATTGRMNPLVKADPAEFVYQDGPFDSSISAERALELASDSRLLVFQQFDRTYYNISHVRFRFDVEDGINGGRDFLQVSLAGAGLAFTPHFNMTLGAKLAAVDRSTRRRSAGGRSTGITRPRHSELSFSLDHLTDEEGLTRLFTDWVRREDPFARILVIKEPGKRHHFYDGGAFLGTRASFDALVIDSQEGAMGEVIVAKSITGITIEETE